jgi:hypothetical protein
MKGVQCPGPEEYDGHSWFPHEGRVPHISLVFREMWDTTNVEHSVHRMNRESEGKSGGIPHLAKNERDMGHPSFAWRQKEEICFADS